jgi:hypothetical protein
MNYHMRDMKHNKPARPGEIVEALIALSVTLLATALLLALVVCLT